MSKIEQRPPITVLFLIKHMNIGGGEYVFRTIIERLDRRAFRPVLACLTEEGLFGRQLREQGVGVHARLLRHKLDVCVLLRLRRIVRRERVEIIYLMDYRDAMLWGALSGRLENIPTILATHSTDWWGRRWSPTLIGKRLLGWHHKVVGVARFQKTHLVAKEGVPEHRIEIIPNGLDCDRYGAPQIGVSGVPLLGIPDGGFVVGTVAVLRPEKNIGMLFAAVQRRLADGADIWVVIIGDGDQRAALEEMADAMGMRPRVKFLGYRDNPAMLLPAFDVFTLTSRIEVMPITILEAMACGVPVVATAVGAVPEIILEGETGYVVPPGDIDALADRLARLGAAPELRKRMGQRGRERVRALYSLDITMARTERLLREAALSDRRGRPG